MAVPEMNSETINVKLAAGQTLFVRFSRGFMFAPKLLKRHHIGLNEDIDRAETGIKTVFAADSQCRGWVICRQIVAGQKPPLSAVTLPAQPIDATQALNLSAGVSNCKVSRGRSLS